MTIDDVEITTKVEHLARRLKGTRDRYTEEVDSLSAKEAKVLDTLVFECGGCAVWFDKKQCHEKQNDWFCTKCVKGKS